MKTKKKEFLKMMKYVLPIVVFLVVFFIQPEIVHASKEQTTEEAWESFMAEYRIVIASLAGIGALTSILTFIYHFIQLGAIGTIPLERQRVLNNMLVSAITTALLGAIAVILAIFYNIVFSL